MGTGNCNYESWDNEQTLYYWGWGLNHEDEVDGEKNLLEKYFMNDKPILT